MSDFKKAFFARVKAKGGWSVVLDRIGSGEPFTKIAPDYEVSRSYMHRMVSRKSQPKLREAYLAARRESAFALAEKATELIDDVEVDRDAIAKVKLQADHRRWLAQAYDRETFGEARNAVEINLNIADLHIDALRRAAPSRSIPSGHPPAELPVLLAQLEPASES